MKNIPPVIGDAAANITSGNAKGFFDASGVGHIYFADKYRGDKNISGNGIVSKSTYVVAGWDAGNHWLIEGISTVGISKSLSLQFEANSFSPTGVRDFALEYSIDKGVTWNQISLYTLRGQITSTYFSQMMIPGHKMYNFNLPDDVLGVEELKIRMRNTSQFSIIGNDGLTAGGTARLGHVSLKYNK